MGSPDLGPKGCWIGAAVLAVCGAIAVIIVGVKAAIWIFNHVSIS